MNQGVKIKYEVGNSKQHEQKSQSDPPPTKTKC